MNHKKFLGAASAALMIVIVVTLVLAPGAWAQSKYKTLYKFKGGNDGGSPQAGLIFDQTGNLYGTTMGGRGGAVFELTPQQDGSWTESVLYRFCSLTNCADGEEPLASLIFDRAGNLYGTTLEGGDYCWQCGTVFELTPNLDGSWTEKVLHSFTGNNDGALPVVGLIFDQAGNLYGTTSAGGNNDGGVVFELTPQQDGSWTESVLYRFCSLTNCADGEEPLASLIFDRAGNLYGTTWLGGSDCSICGTVFELTPNLDGSWTEKVLHSFNYNDGRQPKAGPIFDQAGNLYGTTWAGGNHDEGVVFELKPNLDGSWTESVLYSFTNRADGEEPTGRLIFDSAGNLYGTSSTGGDYSRCPGIGCGVVFKLSPKATGGWKETTLHTFHANPGARPFAGLTLDSAGNLYGTTSGWGDFGSVFEITP